MGRKKLPAKPGANPAARPAASVPANVSASAPASAAAHPTVRIGELAASAGVSPDTLRHYERRGLLPRAERTAGGYREFSADCVARLRTVRAALALGFSVQELAQIFGERERGGTPCRQARALAASKLADVQRQQRELRDLRRQLIQLLADWDARLANQPDGEPARLLDRLGENAESTPQRTRRRLRRRKKAMS